MGKYSKAETSFQASMMLQQELFSQQKDNSEYPENIKAIMTDFDVEVLNIKILNNIYMKNLRFLSYDPETAIVNLEKVLILSTHVSGESVNYKHS